MVYSYKLLLEDRVIDIYILLKTHKKIIDYEDLFDNIMESHWSRYHINIFMCREYHGRQLMIH